MDVVPEEYAMEVSLCTTGCDIPPVIFLLDFPQSSKPVQYLNLEFLQVHAMAAALRECTPIMVGVAVLQLRHCSIIRLHIAGIT